MIVAQLPEGAAEIAELQGYILRRGNRAGERLHLVERHGGPAFPSLVIVEVAEDREHPGLEVRLWLELLRGRQCAHDRVIDEIICLLAPPRKGARESAQM